MTKGDPYDYANNYPDEVYYKCARCGDICDSQAYVPYMAEFYCYECANKMGL